MVCTDDIALNSVSFFSQVYMAVEPFFSDSSQTWNGLRDEFVRLLSGIYPQEEAISIFYWCVSEIMGWNRVEFSMHRQDVVPVESQDDFQRVMSRLLLSEPIQYIFRKAYFADVTLEVDPSVLIPRPETEELCSWACSILSNAIQTEQKREEEIRILDLCTGSGAIAIALSKFFPSAEVHACDISVPALETADRNNRMNGTSVHFFPMDVLGGVPDQVDSVWKAKGGFDLIISNPPYIRPSEKISMRRNVLDYEPHQALFVEEEDPLVFYRAIAGIASKYLRYGGSCMVEINEAFPQPNVSLFSAQGFQPVEMRKDMQGRWRMLMACKG